MIDVKGGGDVSVLIASIDIRTKQKTMSYTAEITIPSASIKFSYRTHALKEQAFILFKHQKDVYQVVSYPEPLNKSNSCQRIEMRWDTYEA